MTQLPSRSCPRASLLSVLVASCFAVEAYANPVAPAVVAGQATFATAGKTLTVTNSPNAIINWQGFSIGTGEITRFQQQSAASAVLNRVVGQDPSAILGTLWSNGRVYLVNPNGILFGQGSRVDVAGLVATTLNLSNNDFLAGRLNFETGAAANSIVNQGEIVSASGGRILLIAPDVQNHGLISSPQGEVVLAAGKSVQLVEADLPMLKVEVQAGGEALNVGQILAEGGKIGVYAGLISQSGVVRADSAVLGESGQIVLKATKTASLDAGSVTSATGPSGGTINVDADVVLQNGSIDASGASGGAVRIAARNYLGAGSATADGYAARGGSVTVDASGGIIQTATERLSANGSTHGGKVVVQAGERIFSSATLEAGGGQGGEINVLAPDIVLQGATLSASGDLGGGTVLIGGDYRGSNASVPNAETVWINFAASIRADAESSGDGGKVIVWSEKDTQFGGNISARGGVQSGNGGFVEVSGKERLVFAGSADAAAPNGTPGTVLLDPKNIIIDSAGSNGLSSFQLLDPNPGASDSFATSIAVLPNNNVVATDSNDTFTGVARGAAYLFHGTSGQLLSTIVGSSNGDNVGSGDIVVLLGANQNNFVVRSPNWNGSRGAVTWGSGSSGFVGGGGAVSSANSLVGATASDFVGNSGVTALSNGNYVVRSAVWDNGTVANAGAVTWGNGTVGTTGTVGTGNSLVGSSPNDNVGSFSVTELTDGNYVVSSSNWNNGAGTAGALAGAVTWRTGTAAAPATVSAANSLVGDSSPGTQHNVGLGGVIALTNGNYVVVSSSWDSVSANVGAVTWASGAGTTTGTVSAANSLVGFNGGDQVGSGGVTPLNNGNYVVSSPNWNNGGSVAFAGAVTWRTGTAAAAATVSAANSLVGSTASDQVFGGVAALSNGNYVVRSPSWNNGAATDVGAVTWGSGTAGVSGAISGANSLIGSTSFDTVGSGGATALTNGNYVVSSPSWDNGATTNVGAATWVNGSNGRPIGGTSSGAVVSTSNSLHGTTAGDFVGGGGAIALTNGNYVVRSSSWSNGAVAFAGAVTWGDGATGIAGSVSSANSLVGSTASDQVGSEEVRALTNGNYVVSSPLWDSGVTTNMGAVTWVNGANGRPIGAASPGAAVSTSNSLVGSAANDQVGSEDVTALTNGNYVVKSPNWSSGKGAATFGNGASGTIGTVGSGNSLVGNVAGDLLGDCPEGCTMVVTALPNGSYAVHSVFWDSGALADVGAVTWGSGSTGVSGTITALNSLTGAKANDRFGSGGVFTMSNGDFVVNSPLAEYTSLAGAGQVHVVSPSSLQFQVNPSAQVTIAPAKITQMTDAGTAVVLQANNDITVNSAVTSNNTSGNGGAITMQAGRSVLVKANITTDNGNLSITANDPSAQAANRDAGAGGITMDPATTLNVGTGTVALTVGSGAAGASSGNLVVENIIAANVNLQQVGGTSGSSILPASTSSLIQATNLLMETELAGSASGASIGTSGAAGPLTGPMRVQVTNLEAHTHQASSGIFIDSPNAGNLTLGGVPFFGGVVKGVQNVASGDILIGVNGTLTLLGGSANVPCGTGTGGPVCTTSGNVTLRAEDMALGHTVAGTGTVALAPYSQSRQVNIESSASGGVLSLTPSEIQNVATAGTLEIGRSDGNATMVVSAPLTTGNLNSVSTLRLYSGNINFTSAGGDIGSSGTLFAHNVELKANNDVQLTVGNIYLANNNSLTVVADNDSSGVGNVNIGGVTVRVGTSVGNTTGDMSITGRAITAAVSGGGSGVVQVFGDGTQTFNAIGGDLTFQNSNTSSGTLIVETLGTSTTFGHQVLNASGALKLLGGTGTSTWVNVGTGVGTQSISSGSIVMIGGSGGSGNYALLNGGGGQTISTGAMTLSGGSSGGAANLGNFALIRSQGGAQSITASGISLTGGLAGIENLAQIRQTGVAGTQSVTLTGGGTLALQGGGGTTNYARVINDGTSQTFSFSSGGTLSLSGGTGASNDFARIQANAGTQTITGSPTITLTGGSAGGIDTAGNYAQIRAEAGAAAPVQSITAGSITIQAGLGGTNNYSVIEAPSQNITVNGNLSQTGGNSIAGTVGAGARIGGLGGATPTATNLTLGVTGDVNLTGGTLASAGSAIGSAGILTTPQDTNITMTVGGNLTLTGGSGAGSRIGSSTTSLAGGDISITAGGNITLGGATLGAGTGVITTGNVLLKTTGPGSNIVLGGGVYTVDPLDLSTSTATLDAANTIVGGAGVISGSSNQTLWLKAVNGIGTQANPVRINNGASGPDLNAVNSGASGDIAVSFVSGDVQINGDLENFKNSNPAGTYYAKSESGNILLDIPFKPYVTADLAPQPLAAGQSVVFDAPVGSIAISSGASIAASGSGNVTLTAGNTSAAGLVNGVYVNGGQITVEAGTIALTGYAKLGNTVDGITAGGVVVDNGAMVHSTSGAIDITGTGGSFASGLNGRSLGIRVTGAGTEISTVDGPISLTGVGGSMANALGSADTRGIRIDNGALVQATAAGSITLDGTGGTGVDTALNGGILVTASTVTSNNGGITLTGRGGSSTGAAVTLAGNYGVSLGGLVTLIESTGSGSIAITGVGGTSENSAGTNAGVLIQQTGVGEQTTIRTADGSITIDGTGGSTTIAGGGNSGVQIYGSLIQSIGAGAVTILGQAGSAADSTPNRAILVQGVGAAIQSNSGALALSATGDLYLGDPTGSAQTVSVSTTTASMTLGATGDLALGGGTISVVSGGSQTVTAGGALTLNAGSGSNESVLIQSTGTQSTTASTLDVSGGSAGSGNFAKIYGIGDQTVSAASISLQGGTGTGNFALIRGDGNQTINVGSSGLSLFGGSGVGSETDNFANIYQAGSSGIQTINVGSGGNIVVFGGDAAATNVDVDNDHGSWAFIRADGTAQNISFAAAGNGSFTANSIHVIGGDIGSGNYAGINARNGTQTITGSPDILVSGGSTGGVSGEGNWAQIYANAGKQDVTAKAVFVSGGEGYENFARLWSGTQQDITASTLLLSGGTGGTANYAVLNAPLQSISVTNDLVLMGGASAATATSGGGARIGGFGGATPSDTNVTLSVGGNLMMTGGDAENSGSAIGSGILGGQTTHIAITAGGNVTLDPGTVVNAGSRIGSPAASIGSGIITVTAGGDIVMNGTASGIGTAIRTAGSVSLQANSIAQVTHTTIATGSLDASTTAGASLLGAGNAVNAFSASNTTSGAIELLNTSPTLTLSAISQVGGAAINVNQTGDLVLPTLTFTNGTLSASGTASVPSGVTFTAAGGTLTAATLEVLSGGTLNGTGSVTANVSNSGTVAPGTSAGILTVSGNYTQSPTGALTVEIGGTTPGTDYDRLAVTGTATLNGTLNVLEGVVAPVAGTTYTVITCGSCTGTFAAVNAPSINATPTYGATSFTLPFTAFLNSWNAGGTGAWETASNWSRGTVPGSSDDVIIEDPSGVATITISSGTQAARSIVTNENLTLSGGSLNLAAPSTVNGTFTLSGGTLAGSGSLTLNGAFTWSAGTISNTGVLTTTGTSTISGAGTKTLAGLWSNSGAATLSGGELAANGGVSNSGSIDLSGASSIRLANSGSGYPTFSNAAGGVLNIDSTAGWSFVSDPSVQGGIVSNAGTINVNGSTSWEAAFSNSGALNIAAGKFVSLQNGQTIAGTVDLGAGATLWVSERHGSNASFNGTTINGGGTVQVVGGGGPVADFSNVSAASATLLVGSGGTANLLSGSSTFAALDITGGTLGGGGNLTVTGSLSQSGGTQSGSGTTVLASGASGTLGAVSVSRNLTNQGALDLNGTSVSGLLTNSGTLNVSGSTDASGGVQQTGGLITVSSGQTLGVGGSGLVLAGGALMGNGTISGNVNNSAGTVAPGASPGILTINGNYTQGPSAVLAVDVGGTIAGSEYDQLVVNGNVSLDGNLVTTLFGSYVPLPGDSYTFISSTGTISGNFANFSQPPSLQPPVAGVSPITGTGQVTVSALSASVPAPIEPSYNYTVVASEISSEPVENILVPVLGGETTTTSGDTTLEKKPPACS